MIVRAAWLALALVACGDPGAPVTTGPSALEQAIARDLSARLAGAVTARCTTFASIPLICRARLPDGGELRIRIAGSRGAWAWRVEDRIDTAPIQAYVQGVLGDLGVAQTASCPPLSRERRIACALTGGGVAFVEVAASGRLSLELELDPAAAAARVAPAADRDLARLSRALQAAGR